MKVKAEAGTSATPSDGHLLAPEKAPFTTAGKRKSKVGSSSSEGTAIDGGGRKKGRMSGNQAEDNFDASAAPSTSSAPTAIPPQSPSNSVMDCVICGDRATGKHYGSISCDGCKGFFRRTIRKRHSYVCRFDKNCTVDKDHRNTCRKCRFDKCVANGMRRDAVQLERDRISATIRCTDVAAASPSAASSTANATEAGCCESCPTLPNFKNGGSRHAGGASTTTPTVAQSRAADCIDKLMAAETTMRQIRASVITRTADAYRTATTGDVTDSMHQQLILMVEWAKNLAQFRRLPMPAQIGLLRHFSGQHLVICAAFRSIAVRDAVWLTNESCVPRDAPKIPDVNRVAARVLDHLTEPMRRLHLDEKEYVALKAVAFFDPIAKGVEESALEIQKTREEVLDAFEYHVTRVSPHRDMPLRLSNLLLLLPPIMAIARDLVEEAQLAKLFGLANVDELMAELLLPEDAENNSYRHLKTSVSTSIEGSGNGGGFIDGNLTDTQIHVDTSVGDTSTDHRNGSTAAVNVDEEEEQINIVEPYPSITTTTTTSSTSTGGSIGFDVNSYYQSIINNVATMPSPSSSCTSSATTPHFRHNNNNSISNTSPIFGGQTLSQHLSSAASPYFGGGTAENGNSEPLHPHHSQQNPPTSALSHQRSQSGLHNSSQSARHQFHTPHFQVPTTSASPSLLSASSPFSSTASSPSPAAAGLIGAAAAAALNFPHHSTTQQHQMQTLQQHHQQIGDHLSGGYGHHANNHQMMDQQTKNAAAALVMGAAAAAAASSVAVVGRNGMGSEIIAPMPIYPSTTASLMLNLLRDHHQQQQQSGEAFGGVKK